MEELGTIAYIGTEQSLEMTLGCFNKEYCSDIVVIDPYAHSLAVQDKISGRYFNGVIVSPFAKQAKNFQLIHRLIVTRIRNGN